jgi:hypothetical protein
VLDHGDTLFLFTDGIEEAKRNFRDSSFKQIVCDEPGIRRTVYMETIRREPETRRWEWTGFTESWRLSLKRVASSCRQYHNPVPGEILSFDFSSCAGTAKDAVLALIAVEKVFRIYRGPEGEQPGQG